MKDDPPDAAETAAPAPFAGVGFALSTLGFAVAAGFAQRLGPLGLEPREFALLRAVGAGEGSSQQSVAAQLGVPASRMVALVDGFEQRGLVERRAHPTDRRTRALYLTPTGSELLAEALAVAVGFEQELCAGMSADERERLLASLGSVRDRLGLAPGVHAANRAAGC